MYIHNCHMHILCKSYHVIPICVVICVGGRYPDCILAVADRAYNIQRSFQAEEAQSEHEKQSL